MKLREKIKRFCRLDVHNHEGFTLVELIIVIAILAILSSVAVVGYSSYVKKANMQADLSLAAEIENALILAMYSDALTAGDYVVIKYNGTADWDKTSSTIYDAMAAAYGTGWENSLKLKYADWELGVVADSTKMGYVNNSTYNTVGGLDTMLDQVQTVVNIAGDYFNGLSVNDSIADYAEKAGITLGENNKVLDGTGNAVANATVFYVANNAASVTDTNAYLDAWTEACFGDVSKLSTAFGGEVFTAYSAGYAAVLGMATYVDSKIAEPKYVAMLTLDASIDGQSALASRLSEVGAAMDDEQNALVEEYLGIDSSGEQVIAGSRMQTDAMAFISYMEGVEKSSGSMFENNDIYSDNYFGDGTILNYVQNYIDIGTILSNLGVTGAAFVFIYDGTNVVCMPLDY